MATKPTFVSYTQTTRNVSTTPRASGSISVAVGDRVAVIAIAEGASVTFGTPTSSGITFSAVQDHNLTNYTEVGLWTGTVASGSSIDVSIANSGSAILWGFEVWVFRNSDGFGNSAKNNNTTGGPSVSLTLSAANSAAICGGGDWNGTATTGKTWLTVNSVTPTSGNGLEKLASAVGGNYTIYSAYWDDCGATGAQSFGMSAPSQKWAYVALEIKGTASADTTADATIASATGVAYAPTVTVAVSPDAGLASAVAAAYAPTVVTAASTDADAGLASVSATAYTPDVTTVVSPDAGLASVTGVAYGADVSTAATSPDAGEGGAVAAAYGPTVTLAASPDAPVASAVAAAYSPTVTTVEAAPLDPDLNIPIPVRVEWLLGGTWVDLTDRTYTRQSIEIERGIPDEGSRADPTKCSFQVNNRDGQLSLRNPMSDYYDSLGRNIPARVLIDVASDNFDRTGASGWGRSSSRYEWAVVSGSSSQFTTASDGYGRIAVSSENTNFLTTLGIDVADLEFGLTFKPGVVAVSAAYTLDVMLRYVAGDYYAARLSMETDGTVNLRIMDQSLTFLAQTDGIMSYGTTTEIGIRFKISGVVMAVKIWDVATGEPRDWQLHVADTSSTARLVSGAAGVQMRIPTASTLTLPRTFMFGSVDLVHYRAAVEVTSPPTRWDVSGQDVWIPVTAAGIGRRLGQGEVLESALTRSNAGLANNAYDTGMDPLVPLDHWPMEDDAPSGAWGNIVPGGAPMIISSAGAAPGEAVALGGSKPLAKFAAGAYATGRLRSYTDIGAWSASSVAYIDPAMVDRTAVLALDLATVDAGTLFNQVRVHVDFNDAQFQYLEKVGTSSAAVVLSEPLSATDIGQLRGNWVYTAICLDNTDTVTLTMYWYFENVEHSITIFNAMGQTYKPARTLYLGSALDGSEASFGHAAFYVGDVTQYNATNFDSRALHGFDGEPAADRVQRLCREQGVPVTVVSADDDRGIAMGVQKPGTLLDLLDQCVLSDMGLLYEPRDELAYVYLSRRWRYNRDPVLELTYTARGHVSPPIEPLPDDFAVTNDLEVQRVDGASSRYTLTAGRLSIQPPPDGVGSYSNQRQLSLGGDDLAAGRASFEVFLSTYDEERYPTIHLDLVAAIAAEQGDVVAAAKRLDSGDRLTIADMPSWQPPGDVDQIALGFHEELGGNGQAGYAWDIELSTKPYGIWGQIGVMQTLAATPAADAIGVRMDTAGSRTSGSFVAGTGTSLLVEVYQGPLWGLTANAKMDFPFDILVSGIILRVTGIAGASSPQTFAISTTLPQGSQFAKTIPSGSEVQLAYPARWGL